MAPSAAPGNVRGGLAMFRPALKLILIATQISCAALASAQNTERPSDKCLRSLNDIEAWHNHALSCGFDRSTLSYAGSPVEQARCLLRRVRPGGRPEIQAAVLPAYLEALVGTPATLTNRQLSLHLRATGLTPLDIGGEVSAPVSRTSGNLPALYFVIHDTSSPEYDADLFGPEIDRPDSRVNQLARHRAGEESVAHVFINRLGASTTAQPYQTPWRATRTERCVVGPTSRGRFLHHEIIQPRRTSGRRHNNDEPPPVAITPEQLDRLALVYVAASIRAGQWLIPAFHATIDEGLPGGHDDPQGFDLAEWTQVLERTVLAISSRR